MDELIPQNATTQTADVSQAPTIEAVELLFVELSAPKAAPGIRSTYPLELAGYATLSGTSMASPHVAGRSGDPDADDRERRQHGCDIPAGARSVPGHGPNAFTPSFFASFATVAFSTSSLTIPAGGSAAVDVTITAPGTLAGRGLFGGYIVITPAGGGASYQVPYTGFKGDYQSIPVLTPASPFGNPLLRKTLTFGPSESVTIRPALDEVAFVLLHSITR